MAITKAQILSRVNQVTLRDVASIDDILSEALHELSERIGCFKGMMSSTVSANSLSLPAKTFLIDVFMLSDVPQKAITLSEYNQGFSGYAADYDAGTLYIRPAPSSMPYALYYRRYTNDVDNIEFTDKWLMALVYLTASKLYENYEMRDDSDRMLNKYELEIAKRQSPEMTVCNIRR